MEVAPEAEIMTSKKLALRACNAKGFKSFNKITMCMSICILRDEEVEEDRRGDRWCARKRICV